MEDGKKGKIETQQDWWFLCPHALVPASGVGPASETHELRKQSISSLDPSCPTCTVKPLS